MDILNDKEEKLLMSEEYDGIKELNNKLPPWLTWLFYITIFFAGFYLVHYHVYKQGDLQDAEYIKEVASVQLLKADTVGLDEANIQLLNDDASIAAGANLYKQKICFTCHGQLGEGNAVGPNLTDEYWINGGKPSDVFKVLKYGIIQKGMSAYKDQMTDQQILEVGSFIFKKLQGSNPPNAKAPQGQKVQ